MDRLFVGLLAWACWLTAAKHTVENNDQDFIDLFDRVLEDYETKVLHFSNREDFGIHRLEVNSPDRFYHLSHNLSIASSTAHSPNLDYGQICLAQESLQSTQLIGSDHWSPELKDRPILVVTPCLSSDSLGNFFSCYFENIMCARTVGVDYMAIGQIYDPTHFVPYAFFDRLPVLIRHHKPAAVKSLAELRDRLKAVCQCPGVCHERPYGLWTKGTDLIRPLLDGAFRAYLAHALHPQHNYTVIGEGDLSNANNRTVLPLLPDAAIHYRCSDNFVGHYGFLPFSAFKKLIPADAKTIYVLAEKRDRKNVHKRYLPPKCDVIFEKMFQYLVAEFPSAQVLVHRGGDLYLDMARLAFAKVTVCSISTYCLWPAIVAGRSAHFPKTMLVVGGDTSIDLGFSWLLDPPARLARSFEFADANRIVAALMS